MNRIICSSRISSNFSIVQRRLLLQQGVTTTTWHQQQQPSCNLVWLHQQEQKKSSIIPTLFVANSHSKLMIQKQEQKRSYYRQQQQQQRNKSALRQQGQHASSNNSSLLSSYYRSSFSPVLLSSHYLSHFSTSTSSDDNNNDDDDVKGNMDVKGDKSNNMDDDMEFDTTAVTADEETSSSSNNNSIRLSKLLSAYLGSISRRQVERTIKSGQVTMAGKTIKSPHLLVSQEQLQEWCSSSSPGVVMFKFGNQPIQLTPEFVDSLFDTNNTTASNNKNNNANTKVWLVHKLKGELVSESDPEKDRPCLIPRLIRSGVGRTKRKRSAVHLKPIGRLDYMTEGLILVTTSGQYAREMELPTNQLHRTYRVRIHGSLTQAKIQAIQRGITIDGIRYEPMKVRILKTPQNSSSNTTKINAWIEITCAQGKNRQVRNVLSHLGLTVYRLIRVSFGDYQLQTIPPGMAIPVPMKPIETQIHKGPLFNFAKTKNQQALKDNDEYTQQQTVQWVKYY